MLSDDIETLHRFVRCYGGPNRVDAEWDRIKKALVEGQKPTTNRPMVPLLSVKRELDQWPALSEHVRERIIARLSQQHQ